MTEPRTQTGAVELEASVDTVFPLVADPTNLPRWAPGFADSVQHDPTQGWQVTKAESTFQIDIPTSQTAGTVDFLRVFAPGKRAGAYLRIVPAPRSGSVLVMTLPIAPGATAQQTADILSDELQSLAKIVETTMP